MELVSIFVNETPNEVEGIFAMRYEEGQPDEIERLFDNWSDPDFVFSYFLFNEEFLKHQYFDDYTIDVLCLKVGEEVQELQQAFLKYESGGYSINAEPLQSIFKPLAPELPQFNEEILQKAKLLVDDKNFPEPILRLYGLRISEKTFIITGGAIKITHFMEDHPDTRDELEKLEKVKQWLMYNEVTTQEDIKNCYYE